MGLGLGLRWGLGLGLRCGLGSGLEGLGSGVRVAALEHRLVIVPQCELRASEHVVGIALAGVVHVMRRRGHDQGEHIDGSDVAPRLLTQRGEHVAAALQHLVRVRVRVNVEVEGEG